MVGAGLSKDDEMNKVPNNRSSRADWNNCDYSKERIAPADGGATVQSTYPELMTEAELIEYLRIPEISKSRDHRNVIENLKRMHHLPRIHICGKPLYPREAIKEWIERKTTSGR